MHDAYLLILTYLLHIIIEVILKKLCYQGYCDWLTDWLNWFRDDKVQVFTMIDTLWSNSSDCQMQKIWLIYTKTERIYAQIRIRSLFTTIYVWCFSTNRAVFVVTLYTLLHHSCCSWVHKSSFIAAGNMYGRPASCMVCLLASFNAAFLTTAFKNAWKSSKH